MQQPLPEYICLALCRRLLTRSERRRWVSQALQQTCKRSLWHKARCDLCSYLEGRGVQERGAGQARVQGLEGVHLPLLLRNADRELAAHLPEPVRIRNATSNLSSPGSTVIHTSGGYVHECSGSYFVIGSDQGAEVEQRTRYGSEAGSWCRIWSALGGSNAGCGAGLGLECKHATNRSGKRQPSWRTTSAPHLH